MFTYSDDVISDLHKDAYGFRPSQRFFDDWSTYTPAEKQECWDIMCRDMEQAWAEEKVQEAADVAKFEDRVQDVISIGAGNRTTALEWIVGQETFYHSQDVEHFVWQQGILFTDYGKKLIKEIAAIVNYKEYSL